MFISVFLNAQSKYDHVHFGKLVEIDGSEYVIAMVENRGKMSATKEKYLLFINSIDGETQQVDFPEDSFIREIKQVKIDSLKINLVIVEAKTVDLDGKKGIGWDEPAQIIIVSVNGQEKQQLTEDKFFVRTWTVNSKTGRIIIAGHYDTNNNNKYDKTDKNEILIYDLKTLKLVVKV
jgi:hypothetical protein